MCCEPFIKNENDILIWIEPLLGWHEASNVLALVLVPIVDRTVLHHQFLEHPCILLFGFLQPQGKSQPLFGGHLAVRICLCHWATVQQKRAPSAVPAWGDLQVPVARENQFMELLLACPLPLCQFLEPGQVLPCVFDTARNSIAHELQDELHAFQGWIEAHQEERIELRLECVRVDDLVIALPIVDLSLGERMDHHQVKRSLVFGCLRGISRVLDWKEVFIKRNVEFSRKDLLRVKRVVGPKLLQDFSRLVTSALHQDVAYLEVRGAPLVDELVDVACQDLVDSNLSCCRL